MHRYSFSSVNQHIEGVSEKEISRFRFIFSHLVFLPNWHPNGWFVHFFSAIVVAVLLSPREATLKTHRRKTHFSLIWHSCLGILFIYMCNTHARTHACMPAPTWWHAGESHWQQRSGMKRTSAHLHQHTPAQCRTVNTAIVFWPHFLLGGDKSLFHSHARNKIQLYP